MIFLLDTRSAGRASCSPKSAIPVGELIAGGHVLATAAINIGEVYAGMRRGEESRTEAFLSSLDCYPLTGAIARRAGLLKSAWAQKGRTP